MTEIEVVRAGTWNGLFGKVTITPEHLASVARRYDPNHVKAALTNGHFPASEAALGWVESVREDGKSLYATVSPTPTGRKMVEDRELQQRSVGLRAEVIKFDEQAQRFVVAEYSLDHIALLGASRPAVTGMAPLTTLSQGSATAPVVDPTTAVLDAHKAGMVFLQFGGVDNENTHNDNATEGVTADNCHNPTQPTMTTETTAVAPVNEKQPVLASTEKDELLGKIQALEADLLKTKRDAALSAFKAELPGTLTPALSEKFVALGQSAVAADGKPDFLSMLAGIAKDIAALDSVSAAIPGTPALTTRAEQPTAEKAQEITVEQVKKLAEERKIDMFTAAQELGIKA